MANGRKYTYKRYQLSEEKSEEILSYWVANGCTIKSLAEKFEVSESIANKIVNKYLKGKLYGKRDNKDESEQ
tara:strand:+ start:56 stop:271 length:216 start_codon:yes stop_codon:yes gene_type:complete